MLFEQIEEFFTSARERQKLPSAGCCRITRKTVQHSLFQFTATQIKRDKVLESAILSVPRKTFLPNKNSDKERPVAQIPFFLGHHAWKKLRFRIVLQFSQVQFAV